MRAVVLAVSAATLLTACATPAPVAYGPMGEGSAYGYRDRPNPDGGYTVLVVMPPEAAPDLARSFWDRRAGELCPGGTLKTNVFRNDRASGTSYSYSNGVSMGYRVFGGQQLEGYVYCKAAVQEAEAVKTE